MKKFIITFINLALIASIITFLSLVKHDFLYVHIMFALFSVITLYILIKTYFKRDDKGYKLLFYLTLINAILAIFFYILSAICYPNLPNYFEYAYDWIFYFGINYYLDSFVVFLLLYDTLLLYGLNKLKLYNLNISKKIMGIISIIYLIVWLIVMVVFVIFLKGAGNVFIIAIPIIYLFVLLGCLNKQSMNHLNTITISLIIFSIYECIISALTISQYEGIIWELTQINADVARIALSIIIIYNAFKKEKIE